MKTKNILKFIGSIVICELAGIIGSVFTVSAIPTWYRTLQKPSFNPPSWVFGPVWTTLYFLMGIALFLICKRESTPETKRAIKTFSLQLSLNALWSIVFFGLKDIRLAFITIIALWIAILVTLIQFSKISKTAGALLVPYILWVTFASVLNYSLMVLN